MGKEVEFYEEDSNETSRGKIENNTSSFTQKVIQLGLAKNEKQANMILIILAILIFALSFIIFAVTFNKSTIPAALETLPAEI